MNLLLTHAYFIKDDPKEQLIMKPYVPLGILYISGWLEKEGVEHEVFDTTFSDFETLCNHLLATRPETIGIYVNLMTRPNVIRLISFIRSHATLKTMKIILGGPEVRNHAQQFLNHGADYLVVGEGEESFHELILFLQRGEANNVREVNGICFKDENGNAFFTVPRKKISDIDTLPFPNRKKVDLTLYLDAWKQRHGKNAISVSTMRGCPYTCKWCSRAVYGLSYRRRSAKKTVEELQSVVEHYRPDTFWFVDDVFTISHKWLEEFALEVKQAGLQIQYECITRADRMNEEVIGLLKQSGCFRVWIGAESGSQKVIDAMDRRVDVNQVREMIRMTRNHGIEAGTFIMLGYPGETESDIIETVQHLKLSNPDYFTITVAYPIKGTELYQEIESDLSSDGDWETSTDRDLEFHRTYPKQYYPYAVRYVVNEVNYFKRKYIPLKIKSTAARIAMWWVRTAHG